MADERGTIPTIVGKLFIFIIPAKVLGLLPWRMRRDDRLTREGLFGRMCSIFIVVVSSLLTICKMLPETKFLQAITLKKMYTISLVKLLTFAGYLLVVVSEIYREFTDARTGLQIIESLAQYDRKVKQLGLARTDNFLLAWIMGFSIIPPILTDIIRSIRIFRPWLILSFCTYIGRIIMNVAYQLARLKYCIIVYLLYQRYNHLNEIVLPKDEWRIRGNLAVNRRVVNMRDLMYLHSTLTRATQILVKVCSFELFVWVSSPIWEFLLALHHVSFKFAYGMRGYAEAAQILLTLLSLCWICRKTTNEANKFALQILKTDPELIRARDINEQLDAALYLYHNKISFRVWKFGEVNFPIIVDIASLTSSLGMIVLDVYPLLSLLDNLIMRYDKNKS